MAQPSIKIGQLLGRYRILEMIERGSQGTVYRAHDERGLERDVALKALETDLPGDEAARIQFRREAEALGKLNHPNVAQGFDVGYKEEYGVDFLVTEYIPGAGLDDKLKNGPLPESTVLDLGIQLTKGLEAAHREGVIHRDLKPGNLRITEEGQLKIIDFGLAKATAPGIEAAIAETVTLGRDAVGTLPYMAPEQWMGTSNQRTDVWSTGAVLYEMATGERPFPQVRLDRLQEAIQHREPARPIALNPAISQGLESVILRCLQKDPIRRYQTAKELRKDLESVASGRGRTLRWMRSNGPGLAVAALLIAITAFVTNVIDRKRQHVHPPDHVVFAVIPFGTGRPDASKNAFHRGVAETIGARIGEQNNPAALQLIPPSEAIDHGVETAEAARREFGVDLVLEIGLEETEESLRITCSLVNPANHQQIGARTVTGERAKLWDLEDQLATKVFEILPTTAQSQPPAPTKVEAAENPEGYESYVRGRGFLLEYHNPENIENAIAQFNQALSKSPNYAPAYAGLGEAYWQGYKANRGKDWLDKAKINCEKALAADAKLAEGHTCLGNLYNDTGKYQEAVEEFQRALALDRDDINAMGGLGLAYESVGNPDAAEEIYKKALGQHPQYWAVYNWLGNFYYDQARYPDAAAMFQKVTGLRPDNNRGHYNLGAMYLLEGKYNDATAALNRSIQLRPTASAYSNLGEAYYYLHRYPESIAASQKALELDDKDYLNWGNLGDALYWSPDRRAEAIPAYKSAINLARAKLQINPKDATALAYVAEYSAMVGDNRLALDSLQMALRVAPKNADVMFRAALVYNKLGDQQQTLEWLKKAVAAKYSKSTVRDTPDFSHLQSNPSFQALISGD